MKFSIKDFFSKCNQIRRKLLLFHEVKFRKFLFREILYFLCHWQHYVQMEFENLSVFLIDKALHL